MRTGGPRLLGPLVEGQTQVPFDNALPQNSRVRLFSFTAGAFFAEAFSDSGGAGAFQTDRPLVSVEELAALNEANGKVGLHRFVEPRPTSTPPAVALSSNHDPTSGLGPLLWLGLLLLLGLPFRRTLLRRPP